MPSPGANGMLDRNVCAQCGEPLADGHCAACDRKGQFTFIHREIAVIAMLCVVVVLGFVLTRAAAGANRALRLRDATAWYETGKRELADGHTAPAILALRRATAIARDDRAFQLALAAALAADQQDDAARQVLLSVRESMPEDPDVNVRLARLLARTDNVSGATRYYQNALYGVWSGDASAARRQVRIELIRYLLAHQQGGRALSELLVLSGNLPDDVQSQNEAGQLYMEAGDAPRALDHFRKALRLDRANAAALAGAGEAAFNVGDYVSAQRFLRAAVPSSGRVTELRAVTELILSGDPLRPGLSLQQRQERVTAALQRALGALDECAAQRPAPLDDSVPLRADATALLPQLALDRVRHAPEGIDAGVHLVYRIEQLTAGACGHTSAIDRALLLIGRRHEVDRP